MPQKTSGPQPTQHIYNPRNLYRQAMAKLLDCNLSLYSNSYASRPTITTTVTNIARQLNINQLIVKGSALTRLQGQRNVNDIDLHIALPEKNKLLTSNKLADSMTTMFRQIGIEQGAPSHQLNKLMRIRSITSKTGSKQTLLQLGQPHAEGQTLDILLSPESKPVFDTVQASQALSIQLNNPENTKWLEQWNHHTVAVCREQKWLWFDPDINNLLVRISKRVADDPQQRALQPTLLKNYLEEGNREEEITTVLQHYFRGEHKNQAAKVMSREPWLLDINDVKIWQTLLSYFKQQYQGNPELGGNNEFREPLNQLVCKGEFLGNLAQTLPRLIDLTDRCASSIENQAIPEDLQIELSEIAAKSMALSGLRQFLYNNMLAFVQTNPEVVNQIPALIGYTTLSVSEFIDQVRDNTHWEACPKEELRQLISDWLSDPETASVCNAEQKFFLDAVSNWLHDKPRHELAYALARIPIKQYACLPSQVSNQLTNLALQRLGDPQRLTDNEYLINQLLHLGLSPLDTHTILEALVSADFGAENELDSKYRGVSLGLQISRTFHSLSQDLSPLLTDTKTNRLELDSMHEVFALWRPKLLDAKAKFENNTKSLPRAFKGLIKNEGAHRTFQFRELSLLLNDRSDSVSVEFDNLCMRLHTERTTILRKNFEDANEELIAWGGGTTFIGRRDEKQLQGRFDLGPLLSGLEAIPTSVKQAISDALRILNSNTYAVAAQGKFDISTDQPTIAPARFLAKLTDGQLGISDELRTVCAHFTDGAITEVRVAIEEEGLRWAISYPTERLSTAPANLMCDLQGIEPGYEDADLLIFGKLPITQLGTAKASSCDWHGKLFIQHPLDTYCWDGQYGLAGIQTPGSIVYSNEPVAACTVDFDKPHRSTFKQFSTLGAVFSVLLHHGEPFSNAMWNSVDTPPRTYEGFVSQTKTTGGASLTGYFDNQERFIGRIELPRDNNTNVRVWDGNFAICNLRELTSIRFPKSLAKTKLTWIKLDADRLLVPHGKARTLESKDGNPWHREGIFFAGKPIWPIGKVESLRALLQPTGKTLPMLLNIEQSKSMDYIGMYFSGEKLSKDHFILL